MNNNKMELFGKFVSIRIDKDGIFARDLTDEYNEPSMFTRSKRGIKNAIKELVATWNSETVKIGDIGDLCTKHNIRYHYYCAMD